MDVVRSLGVSPPLEDRDSLDAIQVMTRLERELGLEVDFYDLVFQTLRQNARQAMLPAAESL